MSKFELQDFRQRLMDLRDRVQIQVSGLRQEAFQKTGGEASGGFSNLPLHPADLASRQFEEDVSLSLVGNEENLLGDIEAALMRLDQGTFGLCEECRRPIGPERLEVLPYARHCVHCARRLE
jgi:DnaK suppressor protein